MSHHPTDPPEDIPASREAEQAVLSAILTDERALAVAHSGHLRTQAPGAGRQVE